MSDEAAVVGSVGGLLGLALAVWRLRAPAWHAITKAAIAIAQDDCEKKVEKRLEEEEAKYDAKIDVLLRVIDARAPDPQGRRLTMSGIRDAITSPVPDDNSPTISLSPPVGFKKEGSK